MSFLKGIHFNIWSAGILPALVSTCIGTGQPAKPAHKVQTGRINIQEFMMKWRT
jgi:hypothetical protein